MVIKGESFSSNDVNSGVSQGSVLGPVLFVLFINDLPDTIQSSLYLFDVDTKVFNPLISSHEANKFQQDLVELHLWTEKWLLSFHSDKWVLMLLGKNHYNRDFYLLSSSELLSIVNLEKDLGVIFNARARNTVKRFRVGQRTSTLDLILTNEENMVDNLEVHIPLVNSDHGCLKFHLVCCRERKVKPRKMYLYDEGKYSSLG